MRAVANAAIGCQVAHFLAFGATIIRHASWLADIVIQVTVVTCATTAVLTILRGLLAASLYAFFAGFAGISTSTTMLVRLHQSHTRAVTTGFSR
jgi:hypothetical protein